MRRSAFFRASVVTLALSSCFIFGANAKQTREVGEPEAATGYIEKKAFEAEDYMVVAANPYASWAGKNILEKGGSAIDAAVAVQSCFRWLNHNRQVLVVVRLSFIGIIRTKYFTPLTAVKPHRKLSILIGLLKVISQCAG